MLVYRSAAMRELDSKLDVIAETMRDGRNKDRALYIDGESGVGKTLAVHTLAEKIEGVRVRSENLGSATPELFASRLFGHVRGAFSGAVAARRGAVAEAGSGILFLDEITSLPRESQPKLLGLLEERQYRPVGSDRDQRADCWFAFASHGDLEKMVDDGEFREDLYWRISHVILEIPPLRERPDDIGPLIDHFAPDGTVVEAAALDILTRYEWPGNVRELRAMVMRTLTFHEGITARGAREWIRRGRRRRSQRMASIVSGPAERRQRIVEALKSSAPLAASALADTLGVDVRTVQRDTSRLASEGKIEVVGQGPSTRYLLSRHYRDGVATCRDNVAISGGPR